MPTFAPGTLDTEKVIVKTFTLNPVQNAGTYDIATATSGDIWIRAAKVYTGTAITGLTSIAIQTNMTSPTSLMTSTEGLLAGLTADKVITTAFSGPTLLSSTKKLQYTIVGTGSAGTMKLVVEYMKTVAGADLV